MNAQTTNPPYHQIPDAYSDFSSGNVVARMIDGLGYRFYWASKELSQDALNYTPSEDAQSMKQTLEHVYGLSVTILNSTAGKINLRPYEKVEIDHETLRAKTLENFYQASQNMAGKSEAEVATLEIAFKRGEKENRFPFWNVINGPIADAIYHTGQIVSFRRTAGDPMYSGVSVFSGKTKE